MITISFYNLKGGIAKTTSAVNTAYVLAEKYRYRVLLIDNDMQANASRHFCVYDEDKPSISDVLTCKGFDMSRVIRSTYHEKIDMIPSNMSLINTDRLILIDQKWRQQTRLAKALAKIKDAYDLVLIDNAADLSMSVVNGLVASDYIIAPIKIDSYTFEGIAHLLEQVEDMQEHNENLKIAGGLITFHNNTTVVKKGECYLREQCESKLHIFSTVIRSSTVVNQSTFQSEPVCSYAPESNPSLDYMAFADELNAVLNLAQPKEQQGLC